MPRRPRLDGPFTIHHLSNRGVAKRPIVEDRQDARFLLSRIAREVRRGRIFLHAFALLQTHYHCLVTSITGELSAAMQWIQDQHARQFNRRRRRDGHLFRGRFMSKLVDNPWYFEQVVRYIHDNPVRAGLGEDPADYPWSSGIYYERGRTPKWLKPDLVVGAGLAGRRRGDPISDEMADLIERRLRKQDVGPDPLVDLRLAPPTAVANWLRSKERLADGVPTRHLLVTAVTLERAVDRRPELPVATREILLSGLLRDLAGLSFQEVSTRCGVALSTAQRRVERHARRLFDCREYAELAGEVLSEALAADYPESRIPLDVFRDTRRILDAAGGEAGAGEVRRVGG